MPFHYFATNPLPSPVSYHIIDNSCIYLIIIIIIIINVIIISIIVIIMIIVIEISLLWLLWVARLLFMY